MENLESRGSKKLEMVSHILKFRTDGSKTGRDFLAIGVLVIAVVFFFHDLFTDLVIEGQGLVHVALEGTVFLAISLALGIEVWRIFLLRSSVAVSQNEISRLKRKLTRVILEEFDQWELSETEKEIAMLLIKGLSMQEIAEIRQVKEKTVRQQATGIYAKGNLSSRHELAAHFIEDLLLP